jgi:hypothetical protein
MGFNQRITHRIAFKYTWLLVAARKEKDMSLLEIWIYVIHQEVALLVVSQSLISRVPK